MVHRQEAEAARRRVAEIEGFYVHLAAYLGVTLLLTALNAGAGGEWWVQWVWLGWGIGVIAHGATIYTSKPQFLVNWERRKFRELVRR